MRLGEYVVFRGGKAEMGRRLGVSPSTIRRWIASGIPEKRVRAAAPKLRPIAGQKTRRATTGAVLTERVFAGTPKQCRDMALRWIRSLPNVRIYAHADGPRRRGPSPDDIFGSDVIVAAETGLTHRLQQNFASADRDYIVAKAGFFDVHDQVAKSREKVKLYLTIAY